MPTVGLLAQALPAVLVEKPEACNTMIVDFLANEPALTFAPIRRASA